MAKIEGEENGSSKGPSSAAVSGSVGAELEVGSSNRVANHGSAAPFRGAAETETEGRVAGGGLRGVERA